MAPALTADNACFSHQAASHEPPDIMPAGLQLFSQGTSARRLSRRLVVLDQHGLELLSLRAHFALALTPCVKATAVYSEHTTAIVNAVLLAQLTDQRE
jgi:hypothetical protein